MFTRDMNQFLTPVFVYLLPDAVSLLPVTIKIVNIKLIWLISRYAARQYLLYIYHDANEGTKYEPAHYT